MDNVIPMARTSRPMQGRRSPTEGTYAGSNRRAASVALEYKKQIGGAIADRRLELGLTQVELSRLIGGNDMTVSNVETGRNYPSQEYYRKYAEALEWEPESFGKFVLRWSDPWLYDLIYGENATMKPITPRGKSNK